MIMGGFEGRKEEERVMTRAHCVGVKIGPCCTVVLIASSAVPQVFDFIAALRALDLPLVTDQWSVTHSLPL